MELLYSQEQMLKVRNENYAAGVADERERIIKLLLDKKVLVATDWHDKQIIALIKGENK